MSDHEFRMKRWEVLDSYSTHLRHALQAVRKRDWYKADPMRVAMEVCAGTFRAHEGAEWRKIVAQRRSA